MGRFGDWFLGREGPVHLERVEPLEGTNMSLFNSVIPAFWQETYGAYYGTPQLADKVWVANRCQQLNAQQIASMPIVFHGPPAEDTEPAWVSSARIRTGIRTGSVTRSMRSSTSCTGGGSPASTSPTGTRPGSRARGRCCRARRFRFGSRMAAAPTSSAKRNSNPARVVQIDRNPGTGLKGTSALSAYAQQAWGMLAAGNQSLAVSAMAGFRRRC